MDNRSNEAWMTYMENEAININKFTTLFANIIN